MSEKEVSVSVFMTMAIGVAMSRKEFEALSIKERHRVCAPLIADWLEAAGSGDIAEGIIESLNLIKYPAHNLTVICEQDL